MKSKLRTQYWELWLEGAVLSFLNGNFFSRTTALEDRMGAAEEFASTLNDTIPEYVNSLEALADGLKFGEVFRIGEKLYKVGFDMDVIKNLALPATATLALTTTAGKQVFFLDPYGRYASSEQALNVSYSGITGNVLILTEKDADIAIASAEIEGVLNSPTGGSVDISTSVQITAAILPNATAVTASGCASLTALSCPKAVAIDAANCSLTGQAVSDLFAELLAVGAQNGTIILTGETNAAYTDLTAQGALDYTALIALGWTITIVAAP